jgi:hypothetical protein
LRDDYRVIDAFPATGSEADLLLVEHIATGEQCVAKLYRKGLEPDLRLLNLLAHADGDYVVRLRAHGVSDGVAYEVQEYLQHGTLRQFLAAGPLPVADVRRIVKDGRRAQRHSRATHPAPRFETRKRVGAHRSTPRARAIRLWHCVAA